MQYAQLGRTRLTVSRAGFGGGGIGQVWGPTDEDEAIASVHRALDLGITFFDVAPGYGDGKAEEALGKALEGRTEPVVVATKVRLRADEMDDVAGAVQRSVETSASVACAATRWTCSTCTIASPSGAARSLDSLSADDVLGPVLDAYRAVQRAGKTRFIGLSAMDHHVPTMHRILEANEYDTVLAYYNLLNRTAMEPPTRRSFSQFDNGQIIPLARSLDMGVIGIRSHAAGALTDGLDRPPRPGDALMRKDLASAQQLGFLLDGPIRTLSQAAMVFCLMNPDIHSTVPGVKNRAEAEETAACVDLPPIPLEHLARLQQLYENDFRD